MKRMLSILLAVVLVFTGCGTRTSAGNTQAGGSAIEDSAKKAGEEKKETQPFYGNSTNYYMRYLSSYDADFIGDFTGIVQCKNDGTIQGKFPCGDLMDLVYVDDAALYYTKTDADEEKVMLCYLPITKDSAGDKLLDGKKEKILLTENFTEYIQIIGNGRYFVYIIEGKGEYVCYDRKTGEKRVETPFAGKKDRIFVMGRISENKVLVGCSGKNSTVCRQDLDTKEWETVWADEGCLRPDVDAWPAVYGYDKDRVVYSVYKKYRTEDGLSEFVLRCYNFKENRDTKLCTESDLRAALGKKAQEDGIWLTDVFPAGEQLYIQAQVSERTDRYDESRYFLFRMDLKGGAPVYERELSEVIWENGAFQKGIWTDENGKTMDYRCNAGRCFAVMGDKAFLWLSQSKNKGCFAFYSLSAGKLRKMKKKEILKFGSCFDHGMESFWQGFSIENNNMAYDPEAVES